MKKFIVLAFAATLAFGASAAFGFGNLGTEVNNFCPSQPYTGDCNLCHAAGNLGTSTPAMTAVKNGDLSFFCQPAGPTCTDADGDKFFAEEGCGSAVDCDDNNAAINPGAAERCSDGNDNNCDGLTDGKDATACPALPTCTDGDGDGFFVEGKDCNTAQDCDDNDETIYPGATEICDDGQDNDCDGMVDEGCNMGGDTGGETGGEPAGDTGETLYDFNCASCHGDLLISSDVCGEDAEKIMEAIADNEGGMGFLSSLTDDQIKSIAETLANCDQGDDEDKDEEVVTEEDDDSEEEERPRKRERKNKRNHDRHDD